MWVIWSLPIYSKSPRIQSTHLFLCFCPYIFHIPKMYLQISQGVFLRSQIKSLHVQFSHLRLNRTQPKNTPWPCQVRTSIFTCNCNWYLMVDIWWQQLPNETLTKSQSATDGLRVQSKAKLFIKLAINIHESNYIVFLDAIASPSTYPCQSVSK